MWCMYSNDMFNDMFKGEFVTLVSFESPVGILTIFGGSDKD